jgi:primase-polymerase (primpol)-like protein
MTSSIDTFKILSSVEGYPAELKLYARWLGVKLEDRKGSEKKGKVPHTCNVAGLIHQAMMDNTKHYLTFDKAYALFTEGRFDAIGLVVPEGVVVIDVDNDTDGKLTEEILKQFPNTSAEVSYSGKGSHVFIKADRAKNARKKATDFYGGNVEVFKEGQFLALTGKYNGLEMTHAQAELDRFCAHLDAKPNNHAPNKVSSTEERVFSDEEIQERLNILRNSKKVKEFSRLFNKGEYLNKEGVLETDKSSVDMVQMNHLAFGLDKNADAMERAHRLSFMGSQLDRKGSGESSYLNRTIDKAIQDTWNTYSGLDWFESAMKATNPDDFCRACQSASLTSLMSDGWEERTSVLKIKVIDLLNDDVPHADVMLGAKQVLITEGKDKHPTFRNPKEYMNFRKSWAFPMVEHKGKVSKVVKVEMVKFWQESLSRVNSEGVTYYPKRADEPQKRFIGNNFNLFRCWGVEPDFTDPKFHKIQLWLEFLKNIICNGNQRDYDYLLASLAFWMQYPQEKAGVALALISNERGTGKSLFSNMIMRIAGVNNSTVVANKSDLVGEFNERFATSWLVAIEEAVWGGDKAAEGVLKDLITGTTLTINKKFMSPINIDNYSHFIFTSNEDWVVPASFNERRFFVLDVSTEKAQDRTYFKPLFSSLDTGAPSQLLGYLLRYGIPESFDPRKPPMTNGLKAQIAETAQGFPAFIQDILSTEEVKVKDKPMISMNEDEETVIPKGMLHEAYTDFNNQNHAGRFILSKNKIKKSAERCGIFLQEKKTTENEQRRQVQWVFPPLSVARTSFIEKTNLTINEL